MSRDAHPRRASIDRAPYRSGNIDALFHRVPILLVSPDHRTVHPQLLDQLELEALQYSCTFSSVTSSEHAVPVDHVETNGG